MEKFLKKLRVYSLVLVSLIAISACSGDDDNLKGYWATAPWVGYWGQAVITVYEFVNGNTVKYYENCNESPNVNTNSRTLKINGKIWYPNQYDGQTYTYTRKDNKIIIPMQGVILTQSGKTLTKDGSSTVFTKQ